MRPIRLAAALFVAGALPLSAAAEQLELDPIIVTANRIAQTADESLAAVSVITRDDIERVQPQSVIDLLRMQPGLDVTRLGGHGGNVSVFLRGTNSAHTLVLIDGVRAGSATTGAFAWHQLTPAQIERIEIVRGPRAALYGSDAIGGVIQVFTREPTGFSTRLEYGSYNTRRTEFGYGGGGRVRFHLNASWEESDGFSATRPGAWGHHPDDDGYSNGSIGGGLWAPLWGDAKLSLRGWYSSTDTEYDQGEIESENALLSARLDDQLSASWRHSLQLSYSIDDAHTMPASPEPWDPESEVRTRRQAFDWQHDIAVTDLYMVVAGIDYYRDSARNRNLTDADTVFDESIENYGVFVSNILNAGDHDFELSGRHDRHSDFGGETTGSIAWGFEFEPGTRLALSYGTAFKAPTVNELFHPGYEDGEFAGNPNLDPERSRSLEASLQHQAGNQRYTINVFHTNVENLIDFSGPNRQAINVNEVDIKGAEVGYDVQRGLWHYAANLTLQRARDANTGARLARRPDEKLNLFASYRFRRGADINLETLLTGERTDGGIELPGYGLVNISTRYPLAPGWSLEGRIENLLDKDYELVSGYNTPGRSYFIAIAYRPGS